MYRRQSKRTQLIRHLVVYASMFLSIIGIVGIVLLFVLGYRLDGNNRLEQGALIQFESKPTGASVLVDGNTLSARTPTKVTVPEGSHALTMNRSGYETWQKTITVAGGTLSWINYPILIPIDRPTEVVHTYQSLVAAEASSDRKHMLVQERRNEPVFGLINMESTEAPSTTVRLPVDAYTAAKSDATHAFYIDRWDSDGRYVILLHTFDGKKEWIVLDSDQPSRSINITALLDIAVEQIRFSGNSGNVFFARLSDGTIRKLDLGAATISRALVTNATSFEVYDSNILTYTSDLSTDTVELYGAGIYKDSETSAVELFSSKSSDGLRIATTRYINSYYTAISADTSVTIYRGDYPRTKEDVADLQTFATFTFPKAVDRLTFSREGTYLLVQSGKEVLSYDLERKASYPSVISTDADIRRPLRWIAPAYLYSDYGGELTLREFDGTNIHTINQSEPGYGITFTSNYRYLYSVKKNSDESYSLQRVRMILN